MGSHLNHNGTLKDPSRRCFRTTVVLYETVSQYDRRLMGISVLNCICYSVAINCSYLNVDSNVYVYNDTVQSNF